MNTKIDTKDYYLLINAGTEAVPNWIKLATQTDLTNTTSANSIDTTNKDDGTYTSTYFTTKTNNLSLSGFVTKEDTELANLVSKFKSADTSQNLFDIAIKRGDLIGQRGFYSVENYDESAPVSNVLTYSLTFVNQGTPVDYDFS